MYRTIEQKHGVDPRQCSPRINSSSRSYRARLSEDFTGSHGGERERHTETHREGEGKTHRETRRDMEGDSEGEEEAQRAGGQSTMGMRCEADAVAQLRRMATEHDKLRDI